MYFGILDGWDLPSETCNGIVIRRMLLRLQGKSDIMSLSLSLSPSSANESNTWRVVSLCHQVVHKFVMAALEFPSVQNGFKKPCRSRNPTVLRCSWDEIFSLYSLFALSLSYFVDSSTYFDFCTNIHFSVIHHICNRWYMWSRFQLLSSSTLSYLVQNKQKITYRKCLIVREFHLSFSHFEMRN